MLNSQGVAVCSQEQHDELLRHVRFGQLFELMNWVEAGQPTLCPDFEKPRAKHSAIHEALSRGNHSMVQFLWQRCFQRQWELDGIVGRAIYDRNAASVEIAKFLLRQNLPLGDVCSSAVFETHDDELILMMLERGLSVRAPDGFASALASTGHSKHLIRLYRQLRDKYPDLVTEGLIALSEAVEKKKVRAVALLTWAGVDPLKKIAVDPYEEQEPSDDPAVESYLLSAVDQVRLDDKARDLLKALKVELTGDIWFDFLEQASWLDIEYFPDVYHWIKNPDEALVKNPKRAAKVATSLLKHLDGWGSSWKTATHQRSKLEICEYLTWLGTPMLVADKDYDVRQIRRGLSKVADTKLAVRLIWLIHEKGDEAQRSRLKEIVRTPKMQLLVRQHDRLLLHELGFGPKKASMIKITKRDRLWHVDDYKVPTPCEKPLKKQDSLAPSPQPSFYTITDPAPSRSGYWNRYSHFHRNT